MTHCTASPPLQERKRPLQHRFPPPPRAATVAAPAGSQLLTLLPAKGRPHTLAAGPWRSASWLALQSPLRPRQERTSLAGGPTEPCQVRDGEGDRKGARAHFGRHSSLRACKAEEELLPESRADASRSRSCGKQTTAAADPFAKRTLQGQQSPAERVRKPFSRCRKGQARPGWAGGRSPLRQPSRRQPPPRAPSAPGPASQRPQTSGTPSAVMKQAGAKKGGCDCKRFLANNWLLLSTIVAVVLGESGRARASLSPKPGRRLSPTVRPASGKAAGQALSMSIRSTSLPGCLSFPECGSSPGGSSAALEISSWLCFTGFF